jgi:hypothetical protein
LVPKPDNKWRPIIDLSALISFILCPTFKMEIPRSILRSVQQGQWLTSLDLKDAYFHIPIHLESRRYLRFLHQGVIWQFKALPFGLNTALRVFTKVTAPIVAYAHLHGISMHVYLDDWLINPGTREDSVCHTTWILQLCSRLVSVVNLGKSDLEPSQVATYMWMEVNSPVGLAYPSEKRIEKWVSITKKFLTGQSQTALLWLRLLGHLAWPEKYFFSSVAPGQVDFNMHLPNKFFTCPTNVVMCKIYFESIRSQFINHKLSLI